MTFQLEADRKIYLIKMNFVAQTVLKVLGCKLPFRLKVAQLQIWHQESYIYSGKKNAVYLEQVSLVYCDDNGCLPPKINDRT